MTRTAILAAALSLCAGAASGAEPAEADIRAVREVGARLKACWSAPMPDTDRRVVVAFKIGENGALSGTPTIEETDGPADDVFARSALRAVKRCAPYPEIAAGEIIRAPFIGKASAPVTPGTPAGADDTFAAAGKTFSFEMPAGFCRVAAAAGIYDTVLLTRFEPPEGRGASLVAMAADCETLDAARNGADVKPSRLITINARIDDAGEVIVSDEPRAEALDELEQRFSGAPDLQGSRDEGWTGSRYVERTDLGVFVEHRRAADGADAGFSAATVYTRVDGVDLLVNAMAFDTPDAVDRMAEVVHAILKSLVAAGTAE